MPPPPPSPLKTKQTATEEQKDQENRKIKTIWDFSKEPPLLWKWFGLFYQDPQDDSDRLLRLVELFNFSRALAGSVSLCSPCSSLNCLCVGIDRNANFGRWGRRKTTLSAAAWQWELFCFEVGNSVNHCTVSLGVAKVTRLCPSAAAFVEKGKCKWPWVYQWPRPAHSHSVRKRVNVVLAISAGVGNCLWSTTAAVCTATTLIVMLASSPDITFSSQRNTLLGWQQLLTMQNIRCVSLCASLFVWCFTANLCAYVFVSMCVNVFL